MKFKIVSIQTGANNEVSRNEIYALLVDFNTRASEPIRVGSFEGDIIQTILGRIPEKGQDDFLDKLDKLENIEEIMEAVFFEESDDSEEDVVSLSPEPTRKMDAISNLALSSPILDPKKMATDHPAALRGEIETLLPLMKKKGQVLKHSRFKTKLKFLQASISVDNLREADVAKIAEKVFALRRPNEVVKLAIENKCYWFLKALFQAKDDQVAFKTLRLFDQYFAKNCRNFLAFAFEPPPFNDRFLFKLVFLHVADRDSKTTRMESLARNWLEWTPSKSEENSAILELLVSGYQKRNIRVTGLFAQAVLRRQYERAEYFLQFLSPEKDSESIKKDYAKYYNDIRRKNRRKKHANKSGKPSSEVKQFAKALKEMGFNRFDLFKRPRTRQRPPRSSFRRAPKNYIGYHSSKSSTHLAPKNYIGYHSPATDSAFSTGGFPDDNQFGSAKGNIFGGFDTTYVNGSNLFSRLV